MKKLLGGVFALAWIVGLTACLAEEPEEGEDGDDEVEEVGTAQQEVGVGQTCNPGLGVFCDAGLSCCRPGGFPAGTCRDLQTDEDNCGSCFNQCVHEPPPGPVGLCFAGGCI